MRNACDSDSRCGLACPTRARDAKSRAMWVERCEPLSAELTEFYLPNSALETVFRPFPVNSTLGFAKTQEGLGSRLPGTRSEFMDFPENRQPSGPEETDRCRGAKVAARQFLSLTCLATTLTAGLPSRHK